MLWRRHIFTHTGWLSKNYEVRVFMSLKPDETKIRPDFQMLLKVRYLHNNTSFSSDVAFETQVLKTFYARFTNIVNDSTVYSYIIFYLHSTYIKRYL